MKKILLASAALIAFGSVAAQAADPVKLEIGGYANQWVGYATNKDSVNESAPGLNDARLHQVDTMDDVQIDFKGSTKLDNGVSVGVEVNTNGSQGRTTHSTGANGNGKRSFVTLSGIFGTVELGEQDNVGALIHNGSPDVGGIGGQDGNWMNWVVQPGNNFESRQRTYAADDRSANKVIYITPAFYGLQAGASYTPSVNNNNVGHTTITTSSASALSANTIPGGSLQVNGDLYVYGLAYANTFGKVGIKADLGSGNANVGGLHVYQGGTQVAYAINDTQTLTIGGSYLKRDSDNNGLDTELASTVVAAANAGVLDKVAVGKGDSYDIGASYVIGAYGVSLTYFHGEALAYKSGALLGGTGPTGYDKSDALTLAGAYDLGPGVQLTESIFHVKFDSASSVKANENDGWAAVTGVAVKF